MSIRPAIFQEVTQAKLEIHWTLLQALSDTQNRLGETLIQHILSQKAVSAETAKKLQDDLSALHGKIIALKKNG